MTALFRAILISGSLLTMVFMLVRIRAAKVQIRDSVFWILFSAMLLLLSVFPGIPIVFSRWLGIESPTNFVFLVIIFVLIAHQFTLTVKLSRAEADLRILAQDIALAAKEKQKDKDV